MKRIAILAICIAALASCTKISYKNHPNIESPIAQIGHPDYISTALPPSPTYDGKLFMGDYYDKFTYSGVHKVTGATIGDKPYTITTNPFTMSMDKSNYYYANYFSVEIEGFTQNRAATYIKYNWKLGSNEYGEYGNSESALKYDSAGHLTLILSGIECERSINGHTYNTADIQETEFSWEDGKLMKIHSHRYCDGVNGYSYNVTTTFDYTESDDNVYEMWAPALFSAPGGSNVMQGHFDELLGDEGTLFFLGLMGKGGNKFPGQVTNEYIIKTRPSDKSRTHKTTFVFKRHFDDAKRLISEEYGFVPDDGKVDWYTDEYTYE